MLQRVLASGKKTGTPVGLHVQTITEVEMRVAEGWQFIALGSELKMMVSGAQEFVSALNIAPGAGDLARY
jgi:4-hydroxy-2-oxoheptanedioate aldolase